MPPPLEPRFLEVADRFLEMIERDGLQRDRLR